MRAFETSKADAEEMGAIAFFGDKYGDVVRVLEAGPSIELCGGTHVRATGDIGTIKVVSEGSIGSNLRRIEAVTGEASVALLQRDERVLADAAKLLGAPADDVLGGVQRKLDELRALARRGQGAALQAGHRSGGRARRRQRSTASSSQRVDGLAPADLRELAVAVRNQPGADVVVLGGESPTGGVSLVAAVRPSTGVEAAIAHPRRRQGGRRRGRRQGRRGDRRRQGPGRLSTRRCASPRRPPAIRREGARSRPRVEAHRRRRSATGRARSPRR